MPSLGPSDCRPFNSRGLLNAGVSSSVADRLQSAADRFGVHPAPARDRGGHPLSRSGTRGVGDALTIAMTADLSGGGSAAQAATSVAKSESTRRSNTKQDTKLGSPRS